MERSSPSANRWSGCAILFDSLWRRLRIHGDAAFFVRAKHHLPGKPRSVSATCARSYTVICASSCVDSAAPPRSIFTTSGSILSACSCGVIARTAASTSAAIASRSSGREAQTCARICSASSLRRLSPVQPRRRPSASVCGRPYLTALPQRHEMAAVPLRRVFFRAAQTHPQTPQRSLPDRG